MVFRYPRSLVVSVTAPILLIMGLVIVILVSGVSFYKGQDAQEALRIRADQAVVVLADSLSTPLWNLDLPSVEGLLVGLRNDPDFSGAVVWGEGSDVFARVDDNALLGDGVVISEATVRHPGLHGGMQVIGKVRLGFRSERAMTEITRGTQDLVLMGVVILILVGAALFLVIRAVIRPINDLTDAMSALAQGDVSTEIPASDRSDEIGDMARATEVFRENAVALTESETRYRTLLEGLVEGVYQTNWDGKLLAANRSFLSLLGYETLHQLTASISNSMRRLYADPNERDQVLDILRTENRVQGYDVRFVRRDGSLIWVQINARTVIENGIAVRIEGTLTDMSGYKAAEQEIRELNASLEQRVEQRTADLQTALETVHRTQEELVRSEKMASLGALVAGVAHEVNTPVGSALGVSSALRDRAHDFLKAVHEGGVRKSVVSTFMADLDEATDLIEANLQRAANLVSSFKSVAVDQTSEKRRSFTLLKVTEEVLSMLSPRFKNSGLSAVIDVPGDIMMDSYPGAYGQVLTNLVTNACTHAYDEGQQGVIAISAKSSGDNGVEVCISDHGKGMSEAVLAQAFDPFFTTRLGQGGSGLGLSLVYGLVRNILGGTIDATSQLGQGTTLRIILPLSAPDQPASRGGEGTGPVLVSS